MIDPDLARLRQGVYRLTGAGFRSPSTLDLDQLPATLPVLADLGLYDYAFSLAVIDYVHAMSQARPAELHSAFMAMFEVGVAGAACPPNEAAWVADARTGEVAVVHSDLRRAYLRYGITPAGGVHGDEPDHITAEMEAMAALCASEADRADNGERTDFIRGYQAEFLSDHVLRWVPRFTEEVRSAAQHPAYVALANAVHAFVVHDRELLAYLADTDEEHAT